jgi:glutathione synthase/RimK-type ligase-like ATP-grasp enzyme
MCLTLKRASGTCFSAFPVSPGGATLMKRIGVLFGQEHSFPGALVERINLKHKEGIEAEFVLTGAVQMDAQPQYAVIVDRISHDIPFYRAFLKHAALNGAAVINNPFWWSADDKFFNYSLARKLGVAVPPTVVLPHKKHPNATTDRSMRNLEFPLDWETVFACVGEHGFMKPVDGGGWRDVHHVRSREEFFRAYDQSRDLCMMYQKAVDYTDYFRCYVVGQKQVLVMPYDPRRQHAERYVQERVNGRAGGRASKNLILRIEQDAVTLCTALGYDINSVEFGVQDGIPYAIDFMNPVPDADLHTIGPENFEWIVEQVARLAIDRAKKTPKASELHFAGFLGKTAMAARVKKPQKRKPRLPGNADTKKSKGL